MSENTDHLFVLSAADQERLRDYAGKIIQWLQEFPLEERFADAIYTWQVARTAMKCRLALKVSGSADLRQKLQHWLDEESARPGRSVASGEDRAPAPPALDAALLERDLDLLGQLWVSGLDIDWHKLHAPDVSSRSRTRRIRVPTYPFARQRHWIDAAPRATQALEVAQPQIEVRQPSRRTAPVSDETHECRDTSGSLRDRVLLDIRQLAAAVLGTTPKRLQDTTNLADYGFDSINLANLSRRLTTHFGVEITPVVFFTYSTIQKFCDYLITGHAAHLSEFYRATSSPAVTLKPLCFEERWVTQALNQSVTPSVRVLVCLLSDVSWQQTVREQLASCAPQTTVVFVARAASGQERSAEECAQVLRDIRNTHGEPDALWYLWPLEQPELIEDAGTLAQWLKGIGISGVACGHVVLAGQCADDRSHAHLESWIGLQRSVGRVLRSASVQVVMERAEAKPDISRWIDRLWLELSAGEVQSVLYAGGERLVCRIAELGDQQSSRAQGAAGLCKPGGTYWVTGGAGGLGALVSTHLARKFRARLVLTGRGTLDETKRLQIQALEALGASVLYGQADVSDEPAMRGVLEQALGKFGHIDGVIHAAGIADTLSLLEKDVAQFRATLTPKVQGALVLEALLEDQPLDFVCYFSSAAAVLGDFGSGDYAMSNRFLMAHARMRQARVERGEARGATVAIGWPLWAEGGMQMGAEQTRLYLESSGQHALQSAEGLQLFEALLGQKSPQPVVLVGEPEHMERLVRHAAQPERDRNVTETQWRESHEAPAARQPSGQRGNPGKRQRRDAGRGAVEGAPEPIAIIGLSGRFPGARTVQELWTILRDGKSVVQALRAEGLEGRPASGSFEGFSLGAVPGAEEFDPLFFEISPVEAEEMDPRQRLLLQEAWRALEDAGYGNTHLQRHTIGMFVGVEQGDYQNLTGGAGSVTANHEGILAARLAYLLDLHGPVMAINTACSSGLVAAHQACLSLRAGECDTAIAAGVNVFTTATNLHKMQQAGMLSAKGQCRAFDREADGMVAGEAVVAVVLKRLSQAQADGDPIHAVIMGSGVNYDGKTYGITAPNGEAQRRLLREVYATYGVDPNDLQYVVTHGTGTPLGDPIEINALREAFQASTQRTQYCALTSSKSNLGHTLAASGLVSLVSLVQAMRHETIPASVNCEQPSDYIEWEKSPFYVNRSNREWPARGRAGRLGAVSAFGMSGTNAHVVVRSHEVEPHKEEAAGPVLLVLSAQTAEALRERASELRTLLQEGQWDTVALRAMSYTLLSGRHHFKHRNALVIQDRDEALHVLGVLGSEEKRANVFRGQVSRDFVAQRALASYGDELLERVAGVGSVKVPLQDALYALADMYCQGYELGWEKMFGARPPQRIGLPTYPFARRRYWVDSTAVDSTAALNIASVATTGSVLHPLLHRNTSDLRGQRYTSTFTGTEIFLRDHQVLGESVLPAVAYLEMARAALENAVPASEKPGLLELHNTVWIEPFVARAGRQISISLSEETRDDSTQQEIDYEIRSEGGPLESAGEAVTHCQGLATFSCDAGPSKLDIAALERQMGQETFGPAAIYAAYRQMGLNYGPAFQGITSVRRDGSQLLARLSLPAQLRAQGNEFSLQPSLMDGALQSAIVLLAPLDQPPTAPWLPFELSLLRVIRACESDMLAWVRKSQDSQSNERSIRLDVDLCDLDGNVCVQMRGFVSRAVSVERASTAAQIKAEVGCVVPFWSAVSRPFEATAAAAESSRILVLGAQAAEQDWVRKSCSQAELLCLPVGASIDTVRRELENRSFDQLMWIAPDVFASGHTEEDGDAIIAAQDGGVLAVFRIVKALLAGEYAARELQWTLLTRNTQHASRGDTVVAAHAGISGLIGSLAKEYPHWKLRLLDIDDPEQVSAAECLSLGCDPRGNGYAHRRGEWFRQELDRLTTPAETPPTYKEQGVYVVIGGAGGLGELWSRHLIDQYGARVVWIGRRKLDAAIQSKIDSLQRSGIAPLYISADAANAESLREALGTILKTYPRINGVVHSAVVLKDQTVMRMDESRFADAIRAKVDISVNMDRVFGALDLDFMLFFSSMMSFEKAAGQCNYAAGCTFKDSFAQSLRDRRAYPVKIMNWGYWGSAGVGADDFYRKRMELEGIGSIEPEEGLQALQRLLGADLPQMGFYKLLVQPKHSGGNPEKRQGRDAGQPPVAAEPAMSAPVAPGRPLTLSGDTSLRQEAIAWLVRVIAAELKMSPDEMSPEEHFEKYGLDSILVVRLTNQLRTVLPGITSTLFFEARSIAGLADHLLENQPEELQKLVASMEAQSAAAAPPLGISSLVPAGNSFAGRSVAARSSPLGIPSLTARSQEPRSLLERHPRTAGRGRRNAQHAAPDQPTTRGRFDVAIIGCSGRYPQSPDLRELWSNLAAGVNCISEIPADRWSWKQYFDAEKGQPGKIYTRWGGFLRDIDKFDPLFFRISPREAKGMDPQERLFLECCYHAIEDSGYTPESLGDHDKIGVFVGVMNARYNTQPLYYSIANRVSYQFDFQGPSMAVDTACSSSLTAIHLALESLYSGLSECVIAGGVNLVIDSVHIQELCTLTMLSAGNECRSFADSADGFVDAEGVGAIVLKPLWMAERDGDQIYGVIKGSAINAGGKTNGYTVPNPKAHALLVSKALERAGVAAEDVSYIEAHGTGTALGDPIEIAGLTRALQNSTDTTQFCAIGSIKSNIGHCESAAGIAGLTKVLLQLKHRMLVPSLHCAVTNPEIDFSRTPLRIQTALQEWKRTVRAVDGVRREIPLTAGISSFGAGGANAHVVVQEYVPAAPQVVLDVAHLIIPLSARTPDQLKQKARDLLQFLRASSGEGRDIDLAAMAYTLQVGRESLQERLAFVTVSSEELQRQLEAYLADTQVEGCCQGQVKRNKEMSSSEELRMAVDSFIRDGKLVELARLWTGGLKLDWNRLYGETRPGRISLPGYPFARERYWRERSDKALPELMRSEAPVLHPLLHTNVSDIRRPRYNATFRGNEPFLSDHRVVLDGTGAQAVIPAMVYLEMARAAIENATSPHHRSGRSGVEFYNVVWADPVVVTQGRSICVTVFARGVDELAYEISSDDAEGQIVHCQGHAFLAREQTPARLDLAHLKSQMRRGPVDPGMHYNTLSALGVHYGPTYLCIKALYAAEEQLLAELRIPDGLARDPAARNEDFVLHPVIMDGALQAASRLMSSANPPSLPLALESLCILDVCVEEMFVWVRRSGASPKRQTQLDIDICDAQGRVCIQMHGLTFEQEIDTEVTETAELTRAVAPSKPQGVALSDPQLPMFAGGTAAKPSGISLTTVG